MNGKKKVILITVGVLILCISIITVCFAIKEKSQTISGDWEMIVNPEITASTSEDVNDSQKVYYTFSEPGKYGDGTYQTIFDGSIETGEYKLSEKDGKSYINMGTVNLEYNIVNSELTVTYQGSSDERAEDYVFARAKAPDYENESYNSFDADSALISEWVTDERALSYYTDEIGKSSTFNPNSISDKSKEFQQKLKEYNIDAVISGNCGCGICTVKETGNGLAAEYAGIPAVVVGAEAFIPQIESTGYNRGVPVVRTAAYPGAFANDTTEEQQRKSREVLYPQIVTALTTQITQEERDRIAGDIAGVNYDDIVFTGSYERVQQYYEVNEMSDGLTVVPPTGEMVEYYLQYTTYEATDIVNMRNGEVQDVPPANREILAYHVAVNAIMAGCPPEYMPLCIAITICFANGNFYKSLASTHGWTPYVLVSGPIARQLGISYEDGMINEEANKLLGRFVSLAMLNLAGYKIKENRMGNASCKKISGLLKVNPTYPAEVTRLV